MATSKSFSLVGSSITQCWFYAVELSAAQDQQFVIHWNETNYPPVSLNFYIAPRSSLHQLWYCTDGPESLYFNDGAIGVASWSSPTAGTYVILLVNYQYAKVSGALSIVSLNGAVSITSTWYGTVRPYDCLGAGCFGGM